MDDTTDFRAIFVSTAICLVECKRRYDTAPTASERARAQAEAAGMLTCWLRLTRAWTNRGAHERSSRTIEHLARFSIEACNQAPASHVSGVGDAAWDYQKVTASVAASLRRLDCEAIWRLEENNDSLWDIANGIVRGWSELVGEAARPEDVAMFEEIIDELGGCNVLRSG